MVAWREVLSAGKALGLDFERAIFCAAGFHVHGDKLQNALIASDEAFLWGRLEKWWVYGGLCHVMWFAWLS